MRHINRTTLATIFNAVVAVICLLVFFVGQANAVWYEATGQAVIRNGDKEAARRAATQEARPGLTGMIMAIALLVKWNNWSWLMKSTAAMC